MIRRHRTIIASLTCSALAAGCQAGGDTEGKAGSTKRGTAGDSSQARPQTTPAVATFDVEVQMTGLLLIVPPKQPGTTYVFLPKPSVNHYALFGFGIPASMSSGDVSRLCSQGIVPGDNAAKMCYVNLDAWLLQPIDGGGTPPSGAFDLEKVGLMNVTEASGGYKVDLAKIDSRARIDFRVGAPGESCKLATWTYKPSVNDQPGSPVEKRLANLVPWTMQLPTGFELVFKPKLSGSPVRVPLVADGNGKVALILAHIPVGEVGDLPPGQQGGAIHTGSDTATHFDDYYRFVGVPSTQGTEHRRPLPRIKTKHSTSGCPLELTTLTAATGDTVVIGDTVAIGDTLAIPGTRTYACMPAAAELGP